MTTTHGLGPTQLYRPDQRLLRGKGVASAAGAGRAEDWVDLDHRVDINTTEWFRRRRSRDRDQDRVRVRVGFLWVGLREIADWDRAPYWQEETPGSGAPTWTRPPTESETALCLCHDDPRVRAAALALAGSGALPGSVLPLVLIRTADTDERVRGLARAVFDGMLAGHDEASRRRLAALAALVGTRRHGAWVRDAVLGPLGGPPEEAVTELLAGRNPRTRIAALDAVAAYGAPCAARAWSLAGNDPDEAVRVHAVRAAIRLALASGRRAALDDARARFLTHLDTDRSPRFRLDTLAVAVESGLLRAQDLAALARTHGYRKVRRHSCAAALAHPEADTVLDELLSARDTYVRAAAVGRLREAGRGDELERHLTDPSTGVRAAACRELRAAGADPRAHYRVLCAAPAATVAPAALVGLAEQGHPEDAALLRPLTRHPRGAVRARALSALRMLRVLPDDALPRYTGDPDPAVRATALAMLRDRPGPGDPCRGPFDAVRARALALLQGRAEPWDGSSPLLDDDARNNGLDPAEPPGPRRARTPLADRPDFLRRLPGRSAYGDRRG